VKWRVLGVFLVLGLIVYAPALRGSFQFDDKRVVLDPKVRENPQAWGDGGLWGTRGLAQGSFWLDWRLWGEKTAMYHVENVVIHVLASWLVFILIRQLLSSTGSKSSISSKGIFWLAVFGGLVFLLHPLQTQAVAYISQRFESLAAMFYLLAVVLYLKARVQVHSRSVLYLVSWLAGMAAASSKEIAITLPIMLVVLEFLVIRPRWGYHWLILGAFFLIPVKIAAQVIMSGNWGGQAPTVADISRQLAVVERQEPAMTRWTYLLTEVNVLRTYVRLLVVPVGQSIDHDYALQTGWDAKTIASLAGLVGLVIISILALRYAQGKPITLAIWWWFITLAPTSSVIPIRDVIYEHRMYLAMVGWVLLLVWVGDKTYKSYKTYVTYILVVLLLLYSGLTVARNTVWASEVKLWGDAWKKGPNKDRTNKNYGFVLTQEKRFSEGVARLERAVEFKPEDQDYRITLGAAYLQVQEWEQARQQFERATQLRPDKADGWNNLGVALFQLKRYGEAKQMFLRALELNDRFYMAWLGLGGTQVVLGDLEAARVALNRAVEIDPKAPEAYRNLAILEQIKTSRD
jgi:protein O-mannosyl-transferase